MQCPGLHISKLADVNAGAAAQILRSAAAVVLAPMQRRAQMRGEANYPSSRDKEIRCAWESTSSDQGTNYPGLL